MNSVLGKISEQTGVAILYDEKLADQKVTGHYKNIKFSEAIDRLFSGTNKSIQVLGSEKKIMVKTFGAKNYISSRSDSSVITKAEYDKKVQAHSKDSNTVEPMTGISWQEIELVAKREKAAYDAYLNDPNAVEPITGVSLQEIGRGALWCLSRVSRMGF
ncbi:MAG: hypothetical protein D3910_09825 [Candidatus Electrothrix sp. ATG2]|nr:hypothetical protein [Candidatus Electrothrix sp. ATG2]